MSCGLLSFSALCIIQFIFHRHNGHTTEEVLHSWTYVRWAGNKTNHMHHIHEIWCGHVTIPNHKSTLPSLCHYAANIVLSCVQKTKLLLVTHFGAGGIKARQKNKWPKLVFKKHRSKRPVSYLQIDFGLPLTGVWSKYKRDIGIIRNDFRVTSEKFAQNNLHTSIWFNLIKLKLLRKLLN